jgi:hypothetical protein
VPEALAGDGPFQAPDDVSVFFAVVTGERITLLVAVCRIGHGVGHGVDGSIGR